MLKQKKIETQTITDSSEPYHLPEKVILNIFSFFRKPQDLLKTELVSKRFNAISKEELLWKSMYAEQIGNPDSIDAKSFKAAYKKMYLSLLRYIEPIIVSNKVNERLNLSKINGFRSEFDNWGYHYHRRIPAKFRYHGMYPLRAAILANADKVVKKLLQAEANVHIAEIVCENPSLGLTGDDNVYPLHLAAKSGNLEMVCSLLEAGAVREINRATKEEKTPVSIAIENGHEGILNILLEHGAMLSADYQNYDRQNLVHLAAKSGNEAVFKRVFFHEGMQGLVNSTNRFNERPLHYAARSGNPAVVKILLENGAKTSINERDIHQSTPLHLACDSWKHSKHLPSSAPSELARRGELVEILLNNGAIQSINMKDCHGATPLHNAAGNGCIESMTLLLAQGAEASLHIKDKNGNTPLHCAAGCYSFTKVYDCVPAIQLLLTYGADKDINEKNNNGDTPYICAQKRCSPTDIQQLFGRNLIGSCILI